MSRLLTLLSYAIRDATKSRTILILVILSLSVSFSAIFMTASILDGFKQTLADGAIDSMGHLIIRSTSEDSIDDIEAVKEMLENIPNVESISVRSYAPTLIKTEKKIINPYATVGFNQTEEWGVTKLLDNLIEGRFPEKDAKEVAMGLILADAMVDLAYDKKMANIGDEIEILTLTGTSSTYRISGIIDAKTFIPNLTIFMTKEELETIDLNKADSEIILKLKDPEKLEYTREEIEKKNFDINITTWREEAGFIDDIMSAVSFISIFINSLLLISVFIVMNAITFINVFQKRRLIGIMKSMGASNMFVMNIYLFETFIYTIISFVIGFLIFLIINAYSVNNPVPLLVGDFHTAFDPKSMVFTVITLFIASLGGSFIPAYIATRTKIVDIIRGNV